MHTHLGLSYNLQAAVCASPGSSQYIDNSLHIVPLNAHIFKVNWGPT